MRIPLEELLKEEPHDVKYGKHSRVLLYPQLGLALKVFNEGLLSSFLKELKALKVLNLISEGISWFTYPPKLLGYDEERRAILMELVNGFSLKELLGSEELYRSSEDLVKHLIRFAVTLDLIRLQKEEMSRLDKHLIITSLDPLKVKLIDYDRSAYPGRPTNLPQLLRFLARNFLRLKEEDLIKLGKLYRDKLRKVWEVGGFRGLSLDEVRELEENVRLLETYLWDYLTAKGSLLAQRFRSENSN